MLPSILLLGTAMSLAIWFSYLAIEVFKPHWLEALSESMF